ncbi:hypothetical protein Hanom_Chr10g00892751 [Helianthus anomalus]
MGELKVILNNHNLRDLNRVSATISVSTFGQHVSIYWVNGSYSNDWNHCVL